MGSGCGKRSEMPPLNLCPSFPTGRWIGEKIGFLGEITLFLPVPGGGTIRVIRPTSIAGTVRSLAGSVGMGYIQVVPAS